jgi:hypothetical protein
MLRLRMADATSEDTPLDKVKGLFRNAATGVASVIAPGGGMKGKDAVELSTRLKELLLEGLETKDFDRTGIDALISEISGIGSRVDPALLSSGPWQAVYTKNSQPLWEKQAKYVPFIKNRSWQDYDLAAGRVKNVGQVTRARRLGCLVPARCCKVICFLDFSTARRF